MTKYNAFYILIGNIKRLIDLKAALHKYKRDIVFIPNLKLAPTIIMAASSNSLH